MPSSHTLKKPERRSRIRFSIVLSARYTVVEPNQIEGRAWTSNISSHGLLMMSTHAVNPGTSIRVVIEWPIASRSVRPLRLYINGTVTRSDQKYTAVQFSTYEFNS